MSSSASADQALVLRDGTGQEQELQQPTQRRRKQRQEHHIVAGLVQRALAAKQRETDQAAAAARTQRRKRAPRKHKRVGKDGQRRTDAASALSVLAVGANSRNDHTAFSVTIENLVLADELEDSDEYADIVADLEQDLQSFGHLVSLHVTRATGAVAVAFADEASARAAVDAKHSKRFGGRKVTARLESFATASEAVGAPPLGSAMPLVPPLTSVADATEQPALNKQDKQKKTKRKSKSKSAVLRTREAMRRADLSSPDTAAVTETPSLVCRHLLVRNLLTRDDVANPDERDDLSDELRSDFGVFGSLAKLEIWASMDTSDSGDGKTAQAVDSRAPVPRDGDVVVEFSEPSSALAAFAAYANRVFGNRTVECFWLASRADDVASGQSALVANMLDAAELIDDDEFTDTRDDVSELLARFGAVQALAIDRTSGTITVQFEAADGAARAVAKLHNSVYGGRTITASLLVSDAAMEVGGSPAAAAVATSVRDPVTERPLEPQPSMTPEAAGVVTQLLLRLASLQERAHHRDPVHDKRSRRLVLGLHEVRRGLVAKKIQLLLVATDVEPCGALDDKVAEILAIARREDVPIAFPMSRRKLGRAVDKNVRVSCVGVYSCEGANDLFAAVLRGCATSSS